MKFKQTYTSTSYTDIDIYSHGLSENLYILCNCKIITITHYRFNKKIIKKEHFPMTAMASVFYLEQTGVSGVQDVMLCQVYTISWCVRCRRCRVQFVVVCQV